MRPLDRGHWPCREDLMPMSFAHYQEAQPHLLDRLGWQRDRARRTLELTGLDRRPGRAREPSDADHRWRKREEAWKKAQMARDVLRYARSEGVLSITVELAVATGFWSIWMTVFEDDPEVRARLIRAFPGTAADCFDAATRPTRRPGGAV